MLVWGKRMEIWLLYVVGFLYFAVSNLSRMLQLAGIPREAMYILFMIFLAAFFAKNLRGIRPVDVMYYVVVGPLAVGGLMKYAPYIGSALDILAVLGLYLPSYLFFRLFSLHEDILSECVTYAGWFSAVYLLPYYLFFVRANVLTYSMPYAYWVSFPICVLFYGFFVTKRLWNLLFAAVLYASLVLAGCRGALLLTTLFCLYTVLDATLRYRWRLTSGKILYILGGLAVLVLLLVSLASIVSYLEHFSAVSRNIRKLFEGNYFESSTRDVIYQTCRQLISAHPGGYGPLASRKFLLWDNYPHSLWYELQLDFGVLLGIFLFCFLCCITCYNVWAYRNSKLSMLVNYLAIIGMGSLMRSSSYYYEMVVPAMLGLFVARLMDAHRRRFRKFVAHVNSPPSVDTERIAYHAR